MKLTMRKQATFQERIRSTTHMPVQVRPHVFNWSDKQRAIGKRLFLPKKWVYTNSAITAYHVSGRLLVRNYPKRFTYRERNYGLMYASGR